MTKDEMTVQFITAMLQAGRHTRGGAHSEHTVTALITEAEELAENVILTGMARQAQEQARAQAVLALGTEPNVRTDALVITFNAPNGMEIKRYIDWRSLERARDQKGLIMSTVDGILTRELDAIMVGF